MTIQSFFNLNLISEGQWLKVRILNSNPKDDIIVKYERKKQILDNELFNLQNHTIAFLESEIVDTDVENNRSILIIHLYNKGIRKGDK